MDTGKIIVKNNKGEEIECNILFTFDSEDIKNVVDDFIKKRMGSHALSIITRMDEDIIHDSHFDTEDYLVKHFAKSFGKASSFKRVQLSPSFPTKIG